LWTAGATVAERESRTAQFEHATVSRPPATSPLHRCELLRATSAVVAIAAPPRLFSRFIAQFCFFVGVVRHTVVRILWQRHRYVLLGISRRETAQSRQRGAEAFCLGDLAAAPGLQRTADTAADLRTVQG
jgi:hypothetical protein